MVKRWLLAGVLLLACFLAVGCQQQTAPAPPKSGDWTASTEFGELRFAVSSNGTGIAQISFDFVDFECAGSQMSGGVSIENENLWPITDGQFIINVSTFPVWYVVVKGEFDKAGTQASGTWEISAEGTICAEGT